MTVWLLAGSAAMLDAQPVAAPVVDGAVGITAVSSKVSKGYVRPRLPDGSFQPEEYAFGNGGRYDGPFRDASIDKLSFMDIARVISVPLRAQNYVPTKGIQTEKLLIMLHWGTTSVPDPSSTAAGPLELQKIQETASISAAGGAAEARSAAAAMQAANSYADMQLSMEIGQRDQVDLMNARMLGYDSEGLIGTEYGVWVGHTGVAGNHRDALISEIEENRYFVVLVAYDFQLLRRQKKLMTLWETRFSINEPRNDFTKALPVMAQYASRYFGQDSHGLLRTKVPEGTVLIGESKSLGEIGVPVK
ncbi:MAG: hypothetical protein ABSH26_13065 [Opitutaceae bacterium]